MLVTIKITVKVKSYTRSYDLLTSEETLNPSRRGGLNLLNSREAYGLQNLKNLEQTAQGGIDPH